MKHYFQRLSPITLERPPFPFDAPHELKTGKHVIATFSQDEVSRWVIRFRRHKQPIETLLTRFHKLDKAVAHAIEVCLYDEQHGSTPPHLSRYPIEDLNNVA